MNKNIFLTILVGVLLISIIGNVSASYSNTTMGFSTIPFGATNPYGISYNGSDFWIADNLDAFIYHLNRDLINQTDGFSSLIFPMPNDLYGLTGNGSDFWVASSINDFVYHAKAGVNQSDGFSLVPLGATPNVQFVVRNGSDFWMLDYTDNFVYHTDRLGVNKSDGFSIATIGASNGVGMTTNGSDFWITDNLDLFVYHTDRLGVNQSDGFSIGLFGIDAPRGIDFNGSNFFIIDNTDDFVYNIHDDNYAGVEVLLFNPTDGQNFLTHSILFNGTGIDDGLVMNISLFIDGIRNYTYTYGTSGSVNLTLYRNLPIGVYNFTMGICNNDSTPSCPFAKNRTFTILSHTINSFNFNQSSFETKRETFKLNITSLTGTITNVKLFYNGTNYTGTATAFGSEYILSSSLDVPLANNVGNKSFNYFWTLDGIQTQSSTYSHFVNRTIFGLCNSTLSTKYYNLSFKDELTGLFINATIPSSTWVYYLGSGSVNKTYSYTTNTQNPSYTFCVSPDESKIDTKLSLQYQWTDYPQRIYQDILSLTNIITHKILYLLSSTDGGLVTFHVQNANTGQSISEVSVIGTRDIGGINTIIVLGSTDASGSVTFWLSPDFSHTFNFSKSGYNTFTTSIFPTLSFYTISLTSGGTGIPSNDYTRGIYYIIKPSGDYLINNTNYNFNYTLNSTYWDIEQFGFGLYYGNGSLADSTSATTNGGFLSVNVNTLNQTSIRINFYYIINSTSYNGTRIWYVNRGGTDFSIFHFFSDLTLYMGAGMFGIDDFGRIILSIVVIIMVLGGVVMRYGGQSNQAVIMGFLFGIVYFLDIGIGFIPPLTFGGNSIPHFITIVVGLLLAGFLIKEEMR